MLPDPEIGYRQGYMAEPTYDRGYSEAPGFRGIKAQGQLDYRYLHEDVGYGLVFLQSLGEQIGVETPTISAVIAVASAVMQRDYAGEAKRTMETLGALRPHGGGARAASGVRGPRPALTGRCHIQSCTPRQSGMNPTCSRYSM